MIHLMTGAFVAMADCGDFSSLLTVLIKNLMHSHQAVVFSSSPPLGTMSPSLQSRL